MRRALLVSPSSALGGAERALTGLARRLPEHGYEPTVALLERGPLEGWLAELDCRIEVLPAGRTRELWRTSLAVARLTRLVKDADVVLSNQSKGHVYGGLAALIGRRPVVRWQHGVPGPSRIEAAAGAVGAAAIVCSTAEAVAAQRRLTPRTRIVRIHPGVDVAAVRGRLGSGQVIRERLGQGSAPIVGIVGRLEGWKGQDVFLRAAARVARARPAVGFLVVGGAVLGWEGDEAERLRQLAAELGIEDAVSFVGHQDDVYPWFDACDVVVHASRGEPFGLVLVEAMALGRPLVAAASGGPMEIVEDGTSGLLVPPGDPAALADAIERLLDDGDLRRTLEEGAWVRAQQFDEDAMTEAFSALFDGLVRDDLRFAAPAADSGPSGTAMAGELTHEVAASLLPAPAGGFVLDAGAGQGAFTSVLQQRGFAVVAAGVHREQFLVSGDYVVCDLDASLPFLARSLEGIVAIELVEHLEAPLAFLRDCARCLAPDGWLLLTTPNVTSLASKMSFVLRGVPLHFGDHEYSTNGHISPVSLVDVERIAERVGLVVTDVSYSVGKLPVPRLRHRFPLRSPRFRTEAWGESLVVMLRRSGTPRDDFERG